MAQRPSAGGPRRYFTPSRCQGAQRAQLGSDLLLRAPAKQIAKLKRPSGPLSTSTRGVAHGPARQNAAPMQCRQMPRTVGLGAFQFLRWFIDGVLARFQQLQQA